VLDEEEEERVDEVEPDQNVRRSTRVRTQLVRLNEYDIWLISWWRGNMIEEAMLAESEPINMNQAMKDLN